MALTRLTPSTPQSRHTPIPENRLSYGERTEKVACPSPVRTRYDDQIVELFLHAWQQGRFSRHPNWLPQSRTNVEVIATAADGTRLAVEHTRVFAFEDHKHQEELLRPIAEAIERDPRLDPPDRHFDLHFYPNFLDKALARQPELVKRELVHWAAKTLPLLPVARRESSSFVIPIPLPSGKSGRVRLDVEVWERAAGMSAVSVGGYLPDSPQRLFPVIRKALTDKLPKLADAAADIRVLLLDLPTTDSERTVIEIVRELAKEFPQLEQIHFLVIADTFAFKSDQYVLFWIWHWEAAAEDWSAILQPVFEKASSLPAPRTAGTLSHLEEQAREFAAAAKADNTVRAYAADWNDFRQWCQGHGLPSLPAEPSTVALYLTDRAASLKTSSLARRLTTISRAHQAAGHPSPAAMQHAIVSEVWKGIKRTKGTAQEGKKPFLTADLRAVMEQLPADLLGLRDRALLLVGFAGGFRRSELAALTVEDLRDTPEGIAIRLGRSKTDQEGQGRRVALPYGSDPLTCPVRVLRRWLEEARIVSGPLFRGVDQFGFVSGTKLHPDSVAFIVKRAVGKAGLDAMEYAGHSLRAGLATQAAMNGASELAIMKQTGHHSLATVRKYIRDGALFRDNAATRLGL